MATSDRLHITVGQVYGSQCPNLHTEGRLSSLNFELGVVTRMATSDRLHITVGQGSQCHWHDRDRAQ